MTQTEYVSPREDWMTPSLYAYRRGQALTQQELAARAGITKQTIIRLEQGYPARPPTIRKLADALGVEPADLLAEPD